MRRIVQHAYPPTSKQRCDEQAGAVVTERLHAIADALAVVRALLADLPQCVMARLATEPGAALGGIIEHEAARILAELRHYADRQKSAAVGKP